MTSIKNLKMNSNPNGPPTLLLIGLYSPILRNDILENNPSKISRLLPTKLVSIRHNYLDKENTLYFILPKCIVYQGIQ